MNSPYEILAICIDNEGEAFGLPVSNFLKKNGHYRLRNLSKGDLYGGEFIAQVYDEEGNLIKVNPDVEFWKVQERFNFVSSSICLN